MMKYKSFIAIEMFRSNFYCKSNNNNPFIMKDFVLDLYDRAYFGEVDRSNIICSSFTKDYTIILKISIYIDPHLNLLLFKFENEILSKPNLRSP